MSAFTSSLGAPDAAVNEDSPGAAAISPSWAVVSFLFEDAVWCDWIYREFDGERVPRPLIRRAGRFGMPYPERISISPDPADPTQLESYAETLQSSQHLILIVSPASGKSPVLEEHLRLFKVAGGEERVIALVVKGEPASPAAEAGCAEDRAWLPKWLEWRFEENRFRAAGPTEPLVIDARLGVASLAEARARLMAALLEVDREALNELGIVTRPTSSLMEFPRMSDVPPPTPSNIAFLEIADAMPVPRRQSSLSLWICAFAAMVALGVLALWPPPAKRVMAIEVKPEGTPRTPAPALDPSFPLVEARPMVDALPIVATPPATPATGAGTVATAAMGVIPEPQIAPLPIGTPAAVRPAAEGPVPRVEQITRRDRLIRLAESQMAKGESEDALQILEQALALGREILAQDGATSGDYLDLGLLHRRAGTLAEGLSQPATARRHYDNGRRALIDLRSREGLSKDAVQVLSDLDARLRQLRG